MRILIITLIILLEIAPFTFSATDNDISQSNLKTQIASDVNRIITDDGSIPFGAVLFQGNFSKSAFDELNADYIIMPGDRINVQVWGAKSFNGILDVDAQGNLFLPEVGPVRVAGLKHSQLSGVVKKKVETVYVNNVDVYTNLINTQAVAVYVSGFVVKPGRYAGGPTDSVLYYLDQAGGIDPERGSFRDISILRDDKVLSHADLYPFILKGKLSIPRLKEGDVILVGERGDSVVAKGNVRHCSRFEFMKNTTVTGKELISLSVPLHKVSHVSIVGSRNGAPYNHYLALDDFLSMQLEDGDMVDFLADMPGDTIMVATSGAIIGASRYPVKKNTRLLDLLHYVAVEPELANLEGIHIKRKSLIEKQKKMLNDALQRLEQRSLTATSQSVDEANIRAREAELIANFVAKARTVQPDGNLVVGHQGKLNDLYLEDGDVIVIPAKSDVIMITGEVMLPQAVVYRKEKNIKMYIANAGGFSDHADKSGILVVKPNGEILPEMDTHLAPGDQIMVLPKFDTKNMQIFKDISQILFQIAVAAKVVLTF